MSVGGLDVAVAVGGIAVRVTVGASVGAGDGVAVGALAVSVAKMRCATVASTSAVSRVGSC